MLTPVFPDPHTLSLLRNQLRTFAAFVDVESFAAWVLVAPGEQLPALQAFLDAELQELPPALDKLVRLFGLVIWTAMQHPPSTVGGGGGGGGLCGEALQRSAAAMAWGALQALPGSSPSA